MCVRGEPVPVLPQAGCAILIIAPEVEAPAAGQHVAGEATAAECSTQISGGVPSVIWAQQRAQAIGGVAVVTPAAVPANSCVWARRCRAPRA
jgi:hypothetical protein